MKKDKVFNGKTFKEVMEEVVVNYEPLVTRKTGNTLFEFYNQTMLSPKIKKKDGTKLFENKSYIHTNINNAFAVLIKFDYRKKDKTITEKTILDIPVIDAKVIEENNIERIIELIKEQTRIVNVIPESIMLVKKIDKGDLIIIGKDKFYFKSSGEITKFKQFNIPMELQRDIKKSLNTKNKLGMEKLKSIYKLVVDEFLYQYEFLMPKNEKDYKQREEDLRDALEIKKTITYEDYLNELNEILKMASPSEQRTAKYGSMGRNRPTKSALIKNAKVAYESITGLYHKKPKFLHKFLE